MNNTEKFFEAFTELDDDLIENALPKEQEYDVVKPALKIHSWKPWVAGAAVAAAAFGVVFAGFKLFGGGKPGFAPALSNSDTLSGIESNVSFDDTIMTHFMADWVVYDTPEELVNAAQIICTGKVTDISFALLDNMTMRERSDDFYEMCSLFTIYEVEVTNGYKNFTGDNKLQFAVRGGLEGYKVKEQAALSEKLGDKAISVMDHHPEIEIGEEYLFILHWADNGTPTIINNTQTAFPLSDPSYRDSFSNASVNDILECLGVKCHVGEGDPYAELSITHDGQIISLAEIDHDKLTAAVWDALTTDCLPELQLNTVITEQDIEKYGKNGYAIDLVFNDIDAPLPDGASDKKAQVFWHATVLIGAENESSYISYSYTYISLDGSSEYKSGGTYFLGEKSREALLAVIDAAEQSQVKAADSAARELVEDTVTMWVVDNIAAGGDEKYACDLKISMNNGTATISESKTTIPNESGSTKENDWSGRPGCPDSLKERVEKTYPGQTFTATVFLNDNGYPVYSWYVPDIADFNGNAPTGKDFKASTFHWDGGMDGLLSTGEIIGTYPKLSSAD